MNKCKECLYREPFIDIFTGKKRYLCSEGQYKVDEFGDRSRIIDGECEKFKSTKVAHYGDSEIWIYE